jgi:hypothetical protein
MEGKMKKQKLKLRIKIYKTYTYLAGEIYNWPFIFKLSVFLLFKIHNF